MSEPTANSESAGWWGPFEIARDRCDRWRIGPLDLRIQRLQGEWRVAREVVGDPLDVTVERAIPVDCPDLMAYEEVSRFGVAGESGTGSLMPALADRPVVSTPERPFYIPAGESTTVYVGNPVWAQVRVGEGSRLLLTEFPIHTPSDTWFGANTQDGEVCYASRSFCRLRLDELPRRPHRCTTTVVIENRATSSLYLEQMKLPVPYFSLFATPEGALWTEDVVLERLDDELAPMRVRAGAPASASSASLLVPPRSQSAGNVMVRAFAGLFS